jgi:hypothetical protein
VDELRVLVASGDSVGHLSHAAVILDALADLTALGLVSSVIGRLADEQGRLRIAEAARAFVDPHATSAILEVIEELLQGRGPGARSDAGSLAG